MSINVDVPMLVCWKQQRRIIHLKSEDDLKTIERLVFESYVLKQGNLLQEIQIQYYDDSYQTFIDLCSQTIEQFQKLMEKLCRSDAPGKNKKIWRLRIISRNFSEYKADEQGSVQSHTNTITASASENSASEVVQAVVPIDYPIDLHFDADINDRQRKQYESDLTRRGNSTSSSIGGVFLRASNVNSTAPYPTLQFQIPGNKRHSSWSLYLYILTEVDSDGNYYLHASKGIYDSWTMFRDKFAPIPNSNLVNPHKIELTPTDISQGKFEIRLRVCNILNLPVHRHEKLRKFPELNRFMMYDDTDLITDKTSAGLNFASEKYHLGCLLVCDYRVQDRCVSQLTTDDQKRKRH